MIGFVTWPPFIIVYRYKKGGQVTKPIKSFRGSRKLPQAHEKSVKQEKKKKKQHVRKNVFNGKNVKKGKKV